MSFLERVITARQQRLASGSEREALAVHDGSRRGDLQLHSFVSAVRDRDDVGIVAEIKRVSPTAGPLTGSGDISERAVAYVRGGAAAVSVLTEPDFFGGSFSDLAAVASTVSVPVLAKDVVVDPAQIELARIAGASVVLLMVRVLGTRTGVFMRYAAEHGLEALVEVTDEHELAAALEAGASLIAVNSRDLATLAIDRVRALQVIDLAARAGATVVAASGISARTDVERAAAHGAQGVLVGELLMRSPQPEETVRGLVGVRKEQDHE